MFQCQIRSTKANYAAKVFDPNLMLSKESFAREVEVLAQLNHPNLVSLIGIHESEDEIILLTDLFNSSLAQVLQECLSEFNKGNRSWFPEQEMVQWCIQILEGLAYIHSKHIAHRDLKVSF